MKILITLAAFAVALGILIVIHELGHYVAARLSGVKVLRFCVGFGRPLWLRRFGRDQTEWAIAAFPLGGYVKMLDEREGEVAREELPRAFNRQAVGKRFFIVFAGPFANFLLAILFYWVLFIHGVPGLKPMVAEPPHASAAAMAGFADQDHIVKVGGTTVQTWHDVRWALLQRALHKDVVEVEVRDSAGRDAVRTLDLSGLSVGEMSGDLLVALGLMRYEAHIEAVIGQVLEGSVAEHAGLQSGDRVLRVNDYPVRYWEDFVEWVRANPAKPLDIEIKRGTDLQTILVVPEVVSEGGREMGRIGTAPRMNVEMMKDMMVEVSYPVGVSLVKAMEKTGEMAWFSLKMLGKMVMGEVSLKNISGPITIADYAGQSAQVGGVAYLNFLALISISLGVLNLLPIPLLDGGHLMYYTVEFVRGRPVSERAMELGQRLGMALLFTLMLFAIYNDINRLMSSSS
ncbi:MAG: RIP metalloprotease RseP [Pseudomonadota bacterium]